MELIRTRFLDERNKDFRIGGYDINWEFRLDKETPKPGWVVGLEKRTVHIFDCETHQEIPVEGFPGGKTVTYWEAWPVAANSIEPRAGLAAHTDKTLAGPKPVNTIGIETQVLFLKFFYEVLLGPLRPLDTPPYGPGPNNHQGGIVPGWIVPDWIVNSHPFSGGAPSTTVRPEWWKDAPSNNEETATRTVTAI